MTTEINSTEAAVTFCPGKESVKNEWPTLGMQKGALEPKVKLTQWLSPSHREAGSAGALPAPSGLLVVETSTQTDETKHACGKTIKINLRNTN